MDKPMVVSLSENPDFQTPLNVAKLGKPYLYLGFIPAYRTAADRRGDAWVSVICYPGGFHWYNRNDAPTL